RDYSNRRRGTLPVHVDRARLPPRRRSTNDAVRLGPSVPDLSRGDAVGPPFYLRRVGGAGATGHVRRGVWIRRRWGRWRVHHASEPRGLLSLAPPSADASRRGRT